MPVSLLFDEVRADFPALERHIYLNSAAASPTPRVVHQAVATYLQRLHDDGDLWWDRWLEEREDVRARVARFVNAHPDEIAFVPNTSTGMNIAADLVAGEGAVLTDALEFPTVTLPWVHRGCRLHYLQATPDGSLPAGIFHSMTAPRAATIAVSHVQFSNGCRLDLEAVGRLKGERHLVVSGSQSVGVLPMDVKAFGVDALAVAGHKWMCAGYGAGFAYIHRALLARKPNAVGWLSVEDPYAFDNRDYRLLASASRFELGCPAFPGVFALGAAVDYLAGIGIDRIAARALALAEYLTTELVRAGMRVLSPGGEYRSAETLVQVPDPPRAVAFLKSRRIIVTEKRQGIRISTHFFNNEEDVDAVVGALRDYAALT